MCWTGLCGKLKQMHIHSRIAWERLQGVKITARRKKILEFYAWANKPMTDRQAKHGMGFNDMNQVRPRVTELLKMNALLEHSHIKDRVTKTMVRTCKVNPKILLAGQADLFD